MNILICEDEAPARKQISRLIEEVFEYAKIIGAVETGAEALSAIRKYDLDLIFMDVELADGPCFETLDKIEVRTPIIFTTAYDEYALKAFSLNSIDYIVKPITRENIEGAFNKYQRVKNAFGKAPGFTFSKKMIDRNDYKERFLVKLGRKLFPLTVEDIAYFMSQDKMVWIVTHERKRFIINYTLGELEEILDPDMFFRLNRQYITNIQSIVELEPYFKGQVTVKITPPVEEDIIISRSKTPDLKKWLGV